MVTIQTAVQVALELQLRGLESQAEQIYRSILQENPLNAEAFHLLGVVFYQKGDIVNAIPYIEQALKVTFVGNNLYEHPFFHLCISINNF